MKCHNCGKKATFKDIDPYLEEICPESENPEVWWCEECYTDALGEI